MEEVQEVKPKQTKKQLLMEIIRFLIVGGLATLVDWIISYGLEAILPSMSLGSWSIRGALASTIGFMISLVLNYFLNVIFVYKEKQNENSGKSAKDFGMFFLISILVLAFQLLFIFLVNDLWFVQGLKWEAIVIGSLTWGYMIAKVIATGVGLVANYILRKILIFK